ncbi:MAG: GDSL-type esterase/lipase family protein [Candidatus Bathyarchaeia archaeon]|jgi:lysophospholipase L1-like esterase
MNRAVKLLVIAVAILLILAGVEAYIITINSRGEIQTEPIRVACIGDSLTRGTQYTLDLWHLLGSKYIVGDFGVGGAAIYIESGKAFINETACKVAKAFQPNIVVIMLGTNDADANLNESSAKFISDYTALVSQFQSLPSKPEVWLVEPPPIYQNTVDLCGLLLFQKVIPDIKEVADQTGCGLIDANTPLAGHEELFIDGVHPTNEGAQIIAEAVYSALNSVDK